MLHQDCSHFQVVPIRVVVEIEDSMADSVELEHVVESKEIFFLNICLKMESCYSYPRCTTIY